MANQLKTNKSKRMRAIYTKVDKAKTYTLDEAVALLKELSSVKFQERVDTAIRLGVDPRKSDQVVRSATLLPHGTGRTVRVAVFAQADKAQEAKDAGADIVGMDDLAALIKEGKMDFDVVVATPDAMRLVGQLGQILGPRGLMPNPKLGTVTADVKEAVRKVKAGQVQYRTDRGGIIHTTIGSIQFDANSLKENLEALIHDLKRLKPSTAKGVYVRKITLSTTMGPGITIDQASLNA